MAPGIDRRSTTLVQTETSQQQLDRLTIHGPHMMNTTDFGDPLPSLYLQQQQQVDIWDSK